LTTVVVTLAFVERLRFRWASLWLGLLVVLSTAVLGIHWLTDIVAGFATGVLAVTIALRLDRRIRWPSGVVSNSPIPESASASAQPDSFRRSGS
jgi:membrane-associated phospholipid phosphatase